MKVIDLIDILKSFDPDAEVIVSDDDAEVRAFATDVEEDGRDNEVIIFFERDTNV